MRRSTPRFCAARLAIFWRGLAFSGASLLLAPTEVLAQCRGEPLVAGGMLGAPSRSEARGLLRHRSTAELLANRLRLVQMVAQHGEHAAREMLEPRVLAVLRLALEQRDHVLVSRDHEAEILPVEIGAV